MIEIGVNTDDPEYVHEYQIRINQAVLHPRYNEDIQQGLAQEMGMISKELRIMQFSKQEKMNRIHHMAYRWWMVADGRRKMQPC